MYVYIKQQLLMLLYSLPLGMIFGASWDITRVIRVMLGVRYKSTASRQLESIKLPLIKINRSKKGRLTGFVLKLTICLQDIFCFVLWGGASAVFFYYTSNGTPRFFALCGMALGFYVYYNTLGRLIINFSEYISFAILVIFKYLVYFFSYPIKKLAKYLTKLTKVLYNRIVGTVIEICVTEYDAKIDEKHKNEVKNFLLGKGVKIEKEKTSSARRAGSGKSRAKADKRKKQQSAC